MNNYGLAEDNNVTRAQCTADQEIVISGMAGRFPNSHNAKEFEDNLYNKVDMCDDDERRWRHEFPEISKRSGKTYDLEKFDSTFFRINGKQADTLDPQMRIIMEHAYEAIIDAGINPYSLRGTNTGVFIGACFTETETAFFLDSSRTTGGYVLTGLGRAMFANRLSFAFDLQGPSCLVDTACSSSLYALNAAFNAIRSGECDAAIVGATNLTLHPYVSVNFARLGVISKEGYGRSFDEDASGYVRAEALGCLIVQKAKDAKRIYSTVVYSKTNCDGFKSENITYPSGTIQAKLYEEFYKEIGINPNSVAFVEAHSTGTIVGDPEECLAIDQVFCKNRQKPLPIGSIKSNMGHGESAAGICSIVKCIFAQENKLIPPNINFKKYRSGIQGFEEKRLQVVTEPQVLDGSLIAVNSFGFGGANGHCLLRGNNKEKVNGGRPLDKLPRLVNWAGRTEEACNTVLDDVSSRCLDAEYIGLIHSAQQYSTSSNVYRSFGVFSDVENQNAKCLTRDVQHFPGIKPKLIFVFSGMGSQWCRMGNSLLEIPLFKKSIMACHDILLLKGLNLMKILTSSDKSTFDNVVHSFVGIAAIQIGICDILAEIGIKPDLIVGHSVGELGCAYADGCLTAEEMILCAYSRGLATIETETIYGSMAAVGLGYQQIKSLLPDSIDVACHNSAISSTISGPKEDVEKFVAEMKAKNIFAKEVPAANRAFHSRYISEMGPKLQAHLKQIITCPKKRSKKWLSSSVPKDKWALPESQFCSAEYQTNNLLSPVLFEEVIAQLPKNAVTIEIAPHGLLQAILRKSLPNCINIPLTQRDNIENHIYFLTALGKLFQTGIDMSIDKLYPQVEFPVSRGTPRLSHLIKWNHKENFYVMNYNALNSKSGEKRFNVSMDSQEYAYILDHVINGKCFFPGIGYLQLVWEVFAGLHEKQYTDISVEFEDVKFLRATTLQPSTNITFVVQVTLSTGYFEVTDGSIAVANGFIREVPSEEEVDIISAPTGLNTISLPSKDFYKELRVRGYQYKGLFKNLLEARSDGLLGKVKWDNNWVSFIDCMMHLCILQIDTRNVILPTGIEKLTIRPQQHFKFQLNQSVDDDNEIKCFEIRSNKYYDILQCGGVEIKGIKVHQIPRKFISGDPILEVYQFVPYRSPAQMSLKNATRVCAQYVLENTNKTKITCVEVFESDELQPISSDIKEGFENNPQVVANVTILTSKEIKTEIPIKNEDLSQHKNCVVAIATNSLSDHKLLESLTGQNFEYIILRETNSDMSMFTPPKNYNVITRVPVNSDEQTIVMLQRMNTKKETKIPTIIKITSHDKQFNWFEPLKSALKTDGPVLLYSQSEKTSGIVGLVNCIRREFPKQNIRYFLIDDVKAPPFDIDSPFYRNQLDLNMVANVYREGKWGNYRHFLIETKSEDIATSDHVTANILKPGDFSSFKWTKGLSSVALKKAGIVKIQYSALNFKDVMLASGRITVDPFDADRLGNSCPIGLEYSGTMESGERVMGINMDGSLSSHAIVADTKLLWKCPENWTLAQAATIPIVYSTVYMALMVRGNIQKGKSILIHSGTGGVGLAAIRVCLGYGLTVFTTVGSRKKREFLLNNFPELKSNHIGNSRDLSFEKMIKIETKGNGVDFVLNSLSGDKINASIRCLAAKGKFLEIGKYDLIMNSKIGLREFLREITFHSIHLDNLSASNRSELETVKTLIEQDIQKGIIQPLPTTIYPANDLQSAFRYLGSGKHIGKVLIKIRENPDDSVTIPVPVVPKFFSDPKSSYIILGGLGGFGLELADWLIVRGARQLVLSSRTGVSKPYQQSRINLWKSYGVRVTIATSDITTRNGCAEIIKEAHRLGSVAGIFNLAVVLDDDAFENQTESRFNNVFGPKAYATEHFDQLSRALCPRLQYFVVFSSVVSGRGNFHQTNYAMANSIMERIVEQRHNDNLPGIAIQWGAVGDVGIVADLLQDNINLEIGGTVTQDIASCLEELDKLLFTKSSIVSSMVVAEKKSYGGNTDFKSTLMKILGIRDLKTISMDAKLSELGMDSITAIEIKQTLESEFDLVFSPQELRVLTFGKLLEYPEKYKKKSDGEESTENIPTSNSLFRDLGDLSTARETILQLKSQNVTNTNSAVIIIPGVESVAGPQWRSIATTIKHPVFCLQLWNIKSVHDISTTFSDVTTNLVSKLDKKVKQIFIIGYSYGCIGSIHLAAELEKLNYRTHVLQIDGSPEFVKKWSSTIDNEERQISVLEGIYKLFVGNDTEFIQNLLPGSMFSDRMDKLLKIMGSSSQTKYSTSFIKEFAENLYTRMISLRDINLDSIPKIVSKISLARVKSFIDVDEVYGLKSYSTDDKIEVKHFEGDHISIVEQVELVEWLLEYLV